MVEQLGHRMHVQRLRKCLKTLCYFDCDRRVVHRYCCSSAADPAVHPRRVVARLGLNRINGELQEISHNTEPPPYGSY